MPVVYDVNRHKLIQLHGAVPQAGVPSFSADGRIAFTIDEELHIVDETGALLKALPLGHYANLAPVSPDGIHAAYNSHDHQIWLIELATGQRRQLTPGGHAYFNPVWSPNSKKLAVSTVGGRLKSIDILTGQIHELDEGTAPTWAPDSQTLFYSKTDRVDGVRVNDADIYYIRHDGSQKTLLTEVAGDWETCARLSPNGGHIAFVSMKSGDINRASITRENVPAPSGGHRFRYRMGARIRVSADPAPLTNQGQASVLSPVPSTSLSLSATASAGQVALVGSVPYINQVYDTPDRFDGNWACGASSALMAINYFGILDYWDITCSWPYTHISHYGQYVSEIYTYNGYTYDIWSHDASHHKAYGGYGYIVRDNWADTKGYMRDYINNHGLSSAVDWSPSWTKLQAEITNDDPFVVLNMLTAAGHYIVCIGYFDNTYTGIFNDPYGNKNTPGYPSYDGISVMYDWPGYNNGYQNLNTVHCFIYCRGDRGPTITQQPTDQSVYLTQTARFQVGATGEGTLWYQWQKKEGETFTALNDGGCYAGVNSNTLVASDVAYETEGLYRCTVSNAGGSTSSDEASLTVKPGVPGDLDDDGDVDLEDFGVFQACLTYSGVAQEDPACLGAKLQGNDEDVDVYDLGKFLGCMSGAGIPGNVNCLQ